MRIDTEVCRRKFDIEIEQLRRQSSDLRSWGCLMVETTFPNVDVIFLPRKTAQAGVLMPKESILVLPHAELEFKKHAELRGLGTLPFGVRFALDDFDQRPISVSFRDPVSWEPLTMDRLPVGQHVDEHGKKTGVVIDSHPTTRMPFLCLQGIREYHEHPQHTGDEWLLHRRDLRLVQAVFSVWRTCVESARPTVVVDVRAAGSTSFKLNTPVYWNFE